MTATTDPAAPTSPADRDTADNADRDTADNADRDTADNADRDTAGPAAADAGARLDPRVAGRLRRDALGLVAAVVQDDTTGEVLMLGWMDDAALARTLASGRATYFSRSRGEYWVKGETSGNRQWVRSVALDCDGDALLVRVDQEGPACHTGARSCFGDDLAAAVTDPGARGRPASAAGPDAAAGPDRGTPA